MILVACSTVSEMGFLELAKENKYSEPISHREDLVRFILVWCGRQDLRALWSSSVQPSPAMRVCIALDRFKSCSLDKKSKPPTMGDLLFDTGNRT